HAAFAALARAGTPRPRERCKRRVCELQVLETHPPNAEQWIWHVWLQSSAQVASSKTFPWLPALSWHTTSQSHSISVVVVVVEDMVVVVVELVLLVKHCPFTSHTPLAQHSPLTLHEPLGQQSPLTSKI